MRDFVDFARERGVRRFILQSASAIEAGGPAMGKVHSYLEELGAKGEVEWGVVRPSWFQGWFSSVLLPQVLFFSLTLFSLKSGRRREGMCWLTGRTENFADQPVHVKGIKEDSKIYSATGQGKIPWVSADDIAAVAVRALTDADPPNTEYLVLGPELLTYDDVSCPVTGLYL